MTSWQQRVYVASNALSKIGLYLLLVVVAAFIFERQLLPVIDPILFSKTEVSHFAILRDQYVFLSQKLEGQTDIGLFHLFELFIWAASVVALLRIITGACSTTALTSYRGRLQQIESTGRSPFTVFLFCLIFMPLGMLFSLKFQFTSASLQIDSALTRAPRFFVLLMTSLFCGSMYFFVEGLLMLFSILFRHPDRSARRTD
jgi:hypothetical protein